ncbi:MAG: endonuclease III [Sulfolobales archaeon]
MREKSIANIISGSDLLKILREKLRIDWKEYTALVAEYYSEGNLFPVLVGVILSQNTNDKNSIKAFMRLRENVGVKLDEILSARIEDVEEAIRPAGLWKQKARAIVSAARVIKSLGGEEFLAREDPERLREKLLDIRGVGEKTVDVFLAVARKAPYFAVDTHAMRIAIRWRLIDKRSYREASRVLKEYFGSENVEEAHRLLIALGRQYCRSRDPRCGECPISSLCPSSTKKKI